MQNKDRTINHEKKSVFLINLLLVILVILSFLYEVSLKYFFYFDIILTFILSYFFFKRSRKLAKMLILTNLFIFFYFLYPNVSSFLTALLGVQSYIFIIFYNILIAYSFLYFSGNAKSLLGNFKKFNLAIFSSIFLFGLGFGLLFYLIKEPIPSMFTIFSADLVPALGFLVMTSLLVAFSEQMIFSGFLFNVYRELTSKFDAFFQVSIIFVMFHLLRFEILVKHYYVYFNDFYIIFISLYYVLLFLFMFSALYLYSFKGKKFEGNFFYPLILHFGADLGLFIFYFISA